MNLREISNLDRNNYVTCIVCGQQGNVQNMLADLDGPAFKAYVHKDTTGDKWSPLKTCEYQYRKKFEK